LRWRQRRAGRDSATRRGSLNPPGTGRNRGYRRFPCSKYRRCVALSAIGQGHCPFTALSAPDPKQTGCHHRRSGAPHRHSPRDLDNRHIFPPIQRPALSRWLCLGKTRLKPRHGVAGSLRRFALPSWEEKFSPTPVSRRRPLGKSTFRPRPSAIGSLLGKPLSGHARQPSQPLGKTTFRPHPSTVCSLLGKPAAERPRRPGFPAISGTRSAVFGPPPRPGQPARGAPGRCRGDDIDEQAQKVHLLAAVPPQAGSRPVGLVQAEIEDIAGSRVQNTAAPWP